MSILSNYRETTFLQDILYFEQDYNLNPSNTWIKRYVIQFPFIGLKWFKLSYQQRYMINNIFSRNVNTDWVYGGNIIIDAIEYKPDIVAKVMTSEVNMTEIKLFPFSIHLKCLNDQGSTFVISIACDSYDKRELWYNELRFSQHTIGFLRNNIQFNTVPSLTVFHRIVNSLDLDTYEKLNISTTLRLQHFYMSQNLFKCVNAFFSNSISMNQSPGINLHSLFLENLQLTDNTLNQLCSLLSMISNLIHFSIRDNYITSFGLDKLLDHFIVMKSQSSSQEVVMKSQLSSQEVQSNKSYNSQSYYTRTSSQRTQSSHYSSGSDYESTRSYHTRRETLTSDSSVYSSQYKSSPSYSVRSSDIMSNISSSQYTSVRDNYKNNSASTQNAVNVTNVYRNTMTLSPALESLDISSNFITDELMESISINLSKFKYLKYLNLSHNYLTSNSVKSLTLYYTISSCPLAYLNLSYNNLEDHAGFMVASLLNIQPLLIEHIDISFCGLKSKGLHEITKALKHSYEHHIDVNNNIYNKINRNKNSDVTLKYLNIRGCQVNMTEFQEFMKIVSKFHQNSFKKFLEFKLIRKAKLYNKSSRSRGKKDSSDLTDIPSELYGIEVNIGGVSLDLDTKSTQQTDIKVIKGSLPYIDLHSLLKRVTLQKRWINPLIMSNAENPSTNPIARVSASSAKTNAPTSSTAVAPWSPSMANASLNTDERHKNTSNFTTNSISYSGSYASASGKAQFNSSFSSESKTSYRDIDIKSAFVLVDEFALSSSLKRPIGDLLSNVTPIKFIEFNDKINTDDLTITTVVDHFIYMKVLLTSHINSESDFFMYLSNILSCHVTQFRLLSTYQPIHDSNISPTSFNEPSNEINPVSDEKSEKSGISVDKSEVSSFTHNQTEYSIDSDRNLYPDEVDQGIHNNADKEVNKDYSIMIENDITSRCCCLTFCIENIQQDISNELKSRRIYKNDVTVGQADEIDTGRFDSNVVVNTLKTLCSDSDASLRMIGVQTVYIQQLQSQPQSLQHIAEHRQDDADIDMGIDLDIHKYLDRDNNKGLSIETDFTREVSKSIEVESSIQAGTVVGYQEERKYDIFHYEIINSCQGGVPTTQTVDHQTMNDDVDVDEDIDKYMAIDRNTDIQTYDHFAYEYFPIVTPHKEYVVKSLNKDKYLNKHAMSDLEGSLDYKLDRLTDRSVDSHRDGSFNRYKDKYLEEGTAGDSDDYSFDIEDADSNTDSHVSRHRGRQIDTYSDDDKDTYVHNLEYISFENREIAKKKSKLLKLKRKVNKEIVYSVRKLYADKQITKRVAQFWEGAVGTSLIQSCISICINQFSFYNITKLQSVK